MSELTREHAEAALAQLTQRVGLALKTYHDAEARTDPVSGQVLSTQLGEVYAWLIKLNEPQSFETGDLKRHFWTLTKVVTDTLLEISRSDSL